MGKRNLVQVMPSRWAVGDRGRLSLFGTKHEEHRLLSEHLAAEYRVWTKARGRTVDEWKLKASAVDNHWLDCLVGCAVAASMQGVVLPGTDAKVVEKRQRVRLDLQRSKRKMDEHTQTTGKPEDMPAATPAAQPGKRGLECPRCGCRHFHVLYTRAVIGGRILLRHECRHCGRRMTTYERCSR